MTYKNLIKNIIKNDLDLNHTTILLTQFLKTYLKGKKSFFINCDAHDIAMKKRIIKFLGGKIIFNTPYKIAINSNKEDCPIHIVKVKIKDVSLIKSFINDNMKDWSKENKLKYISNISSLIKDIRMSELKQQNLILNYTVDTEYFNETIFNMLDLNYIKRKKYREVGNYEYNEFEFILKNS